MMKKKAAEMPTEIAPAPGPTAGHSKTPNIRPLAIAAVLALVLHLGSGIMLDRSHASPTSGPAAFAASEDEAMCMTETRQPPPLPYD
jgi:hypothetical protein